MEINSQVANCDGVAQNSDGGAHALPSPPLATPLLLRRPFHHYRIILATMTKTRAVMNVKHK